MFPLEFENRPKKLIGLSSNLSYSTLFSRLHPNLLTFEVNFLFMERLCRTWKNACWSMSVATKIVLNLIRSRVCERKKESFLIRQYASWAPESDEFLWSLYMSYVFMHRASFYFLCSILLIVTLLFFLGCSWVAYNGATGDSTSYQTSGAQKAYCSRF